MCFFGKERQTPLLLLPEGSAGWKLLFTTNEGIE
jgi:hypothetical protein